MNDKDQYQQLVEEFHVAMDLPVGDYLKPRISRPELRAELIREESTETKTALERGDLVETIDGLADTAYVALGAAVEFGVLFNHVPKFSVSSTLGLTYPQLYGRMIELRAGEAIDRILDEALQGMHHSIAYGHYSLHRLTVACFYVSARLGVDLDPFFREVHATNMAKAGGPIRSDGKRLKPIGWQPPRIREMLVERGWHPPLDFAA